MMAFGRFFFLRCLLTLFSLSIRELFLNISIEAKSQNLLLLFCLKRRRGTSPFFPVQLPTSYIYIYTKKKKIQFTVVLTLVMYWWKPTRNSSRYAYCEQLPLDELEANNLDEADDGDDDDDGDNSTAIAVRVQSVSSPRYDEEEMKTAYYGFRFLFFKKFVSRFFSLVNETR